MIFDLADTNSLERFIRINFEIIGARNADIFCDSGCLKNCISALKFLNIAFIK